MSAGDREIVKLFARLDKGRIARCIPSERERGTSPRPHSEGKVIYDTEERARACVEVMEAAAPRPPLFVYACPRSKHGHFHITSRR